jgi:hypothetical protein
LTHLESSRSSILLITAVTTIVLAGCFDKVSVQETSERGEQTAGDPPGGQQPGGGQPGGGQTANAAPVISGTPATTAQVGRNYTFSPKASDPDGDDLTFQVLNLPSWATFSTHSGRISGTPRAADVGTYSHITISVSDGARTATLPAFAIDVTPASATGAATLSWDAPIEDTDGAPLESLAGYRVYYGTAQDALERRVQITDPHVLTHVVENLQPATWYFAVTAYTTAGVESRLSNVASKVIQ